LFSLQRRAFCPRLKPGGYEYYKKDDVVASETKDNGAGAANKMTLLHHKQKIAEGMVASETRYITQPKIPGIEER